MSLMPDEPKLPEARASVTYNIVSKDGFSALFTLRSTNEAELLELMEDAEAGLLKRGYTPKGGGKTVESSPEASGYSIKECPKCGAPLEEIEASGKPALRCSTNEWDPVSKTATGCDFFTYIEPPTSGQEKVLRDRGLWKEGITKGEASVIISRELSK